MRHGRVGSASEATLAIYLHREIFYFGFRLRRLLGLMDFFSGPILKVETGKEMNFSEAVSEFGPRRFLPAHPSTCASESCLWFQHWLHLRGSPSLL